MPSRIEQTIDVDVPVRTAYNPGTQVEEFPRVMDGVREVRQLDDRTLDWRADVGGRDMAWKAEISEQIPDARIAWHSITGPRNAGVVTFHRLSDDKSRVMLQMEYEPEGVIENVGDFVGVMSTRVAGDLQRFKEFIEARGRETGAWRGQVEAPH